MTTTKLIIAALIGGLVAFASMTSPANACTTSNWKKTSGNSLASIIQGRDCGGTFSVRLTGIFGDTGWLPMYKNGANNYSAEYGDGKVLTDIKMQTNGAIMSVNFVHRAATGHTFTQGSYHLTNMQ